MMAFSTSTPFLVTPAYSERSTLCTTTSCSSANKLVLNPAHPHSQGRHIVQVRGGGRADQTLGRKVRRLRDQKKCAAFCGLTVRKELLGGDGPALAGGVQPLKGKRHGRRPETQTCRASAYPSAPARRPYTAVLIIPTGVGAAIGGFAGDALPVARTVSSVVDCLITHPNVLNGAMLYWPLPNTLYVEGFGLDAFARGDWALRPVHQNRIGIILDSAIEPDLRLRHMQVADAAQATLGLDIGGVAVTDSPLGVEKWIDNETGKSTGRLWNPDGLLDAVKYLVDECGAEAIAVVGRFPDDAEEELVDYRQGQGVDALAGVEAVISHMVVERFGIPCAHAPALAPLSLQEVSPRSAAEEIGYTFFPCVLAGLSRAPQFVPRGSPVSVQNGPVNHQNGPVRQDDGRGVAGAVLGEDVDAVIVPADACGGVGTLAFSRGVLGKKPPLIIAVGENETVLEDTPGRVGLNAIHVANYWEAVGVLAAHKAGVRPDALRKDGTLTLSAVELKPKDLETKRRLKGAEGARQAQNEPPLGNDLMHSVLNRLLEKEAPTSTPGSWKLTGD
ncbi:hypothetical protein KFL_000770300 [Klebsormidium nitens]|uniref:DUF3326 domain-containing protein n=1 Tax=Klebsormidium nitens TaxID=105231 RepID=A0A1Y1HXS0_KLENI|nr:hypothetical protein KFL_000770300 [Klebsormidium nitens]|eukprot:GAQ81337.1 hypothetical protein KFL_000770300 [Klebsormidium nitens]